MSMIPGIDAASSALSAERTRLDVIAGNLANAQNTSDASGQVYRRKMVVFESPNVNPLDEMVDMMTASRSYQANLQAISAGRSMFEQSLKIVQ